VKLKIRDKKTGKTKTIEANEYSPNKHALCISHKPLFTTIDARRLVEKK